MTRPITDVVAIIGTPEARPPEADYVRIPVDLNKGCGGKYIYLCFTRRPGVPITDFQVVFGKKPRVPSGYQFVPGYDAQTMSWSPNLDLNKTVGGEYIYMIYTRKTGTPVLDVIVQAWKHPAPEPVPPTDYKGRRYQRIEGELNKGAGGWYLKAAQLRANDAEPPNLANSPEELTRAYLRRTEWELSRAQVGLDTMAVRMLRVTGETFHGSTDIDEVRALEQTVGMEQSSATTIAEQWGVKFTAGFEWGKFKAGVESTFGRSVTSTDTLKLTNLTRTQTTVHLPAEAISPPTSRSVYFSHAEDVLLTYRFGSGAPLCSAVSYPGVSGCASQNLAIPDPKAPLKALALGAQRPVHT